MGGRKIPDMNLNAETDAAETAEMPEATPTDPYRVTCFCNGNGECPVCNERGFPTIEDILARRKM